MKKYFWIIITLGLWSCEDVIDLEVKDGKQQLVVDAWITNELKPQTVKLSLSQPYFNQSSAEPALGAEVYMVTQDSTLYKFEDKDNTGNYVFDPGKKPFLEINKQVGLLIKYKNEEYYSISQLNRVPSIDSLKYENFTWPVEPTEGPKKGFFAQFYATDYAGSGDTYLVRSYKNDTLRARSNQYYLVYDGGGSLGSNTDGLLFIQPVRISINSGLFADGDKVTIELFSIPIDAYLFLYQVQAETNNGGIFATPSSNVPGNIFNRNTNSTEKALGVFMVTKVSRYSAIINKNDAIPEKN